MTREEAVAYLRPIMESARLPNYQTALRLAVEALEERAGGTPEGCEYCRDYTLPWVCCPFCGRDLTVKAEEALKGRTDRPTIQITFTLDRSQWPECEICKNPVSVGYSIDCGFHFCKNCGRPLTEEAWAALERRMNGGTAD